MSRPLRIASILPRLHIGGDENRLLNFCRELDRERYEHILILLVSSTDQDDAEYGPIAHRYRDAQTEIVYLDEPPRLDRWKRWGRAAVFGDAISLIRVTYKIVRVLRERGIDVVDARMTGTILLGALAGRLAGVPVIATDYHMDFWENRYVRPFGKLAFSSLAAMISDSEQRLDLFRRWSTWGTPRYEMIPNGIERPESEFDQMAARRALGLPEDPTVRVVGQVSRLRPFKGQEVLLDAAQSVLEQVPDVWFLICGYAHPDPTFKDRLVEKARDLGIGDRVRILSYPGPIADVWAAVDVQAHASWYDSSPIAVHETMALGIPAVVTDVGGMRELVEDGVSGVVVPMKDSKALADGLVRVLRDRELADSLGREARARYDRRHRPEHMTEAICRLCDEVAGRSVEGGA